MKILVVGAGALELIAGLNPAGILWPWELDPRRFLARADALGLTLDFRQR